MPNLPLDDHLIRKDAADHYRLDYLALGHWHKPLRHRSSDGAERTAYSGTHEPMRFPGSGAGYLTAVFYLSTVTPNASKTKELVRHCWYRSKRQARRPSSSRSRSAGCDGWRSDWT